MNAFDSSSHYTMLISNSLLTWRLILPHITSVLPLYILRASVIVEGDIEAGLAQSSISIEDVTSRIGTSSSIFKKLLF